VTQRVLDLSDDLAASVLSAAARAYPSECCGLIEGVDTQDGWRVTAVHEATNVAENPTRHFMVDPQIQFDLVRALRGSQQRIIGCFHSHPGAAPEPSATDRANAYETDFLWLIAGGSPDDILTLAAYLFLEETGFARVTLRGG
jgi:proteasome lid subunit RPN8/RPN11